MKIVVIGGTGLIGSKTVERLRASGHEVVAASPNSGVNTVTGEGLAEVLAGSTVVIDLANSPSFEDEAVMDFFQASGRNLLGAERTADVRHHIALSVVGTDRLQGSGYFRGKKAQEDLIRESGIPYTIVHSTQFYEFMGAIAQSGTVGGRALVSTALVQPIAADNVADVMAHVALSDPLNGIVEIAGPDRVRLNELVARYLKKFGDPREVIADPHALYFGVELDDSSLVPGTNPRIGQIRFDDWLRTSARKP